MRFSFCGWLLFSSHVFLCFSLAVVALREFFFFVLLIDLLSFCGNVHRHICCCCYAIPIQLKGKMAFATSQFAEWIRNSNAFIISTATVAFLLNLRFIFNCFCSVCERRERSRVHLYYAIQPKVIVCPGISNWNTKEEWTKTEKTRENWMKLCVSVAVLVHLLPSPSAAHTLCPIQFRYMRHVRLFVPKRKLHFMGDSVCVIWHTTNDPTHTASLNWIECVFLRFRRQSTRRSIHFTRRNWEDIILNANADAQKTKTEILWVVLKANFP